MARDRWAEEDFKSQGQHYEMNNVRLAELGLSLTLGANGQVLVIKHRVSRGVSENLYKWTGPQPQLKVEGSIH